MWPAISGRNSQIEFETVKINKLLKFDWNNRIDKYIKFGMSIITLLILYFVHALDIKVIGSLNIFLFRSFMKDNWSYVFRFLSDKKAKD